MILYIAEKPSLGRAIADVLPKPHKKQEGCIRAANGDVVSWCFGHLLELAQPDEYDPMYKRWAFEHLPIVPQEWKLKPKSKTRKQIALLRKLTKEAEQIVHAGDPDREGQLLVDEVIAHLKVPKYKRDAVKRCLISDLNPAAVKKALSQLRDNREFIPLSCSALARSRADWLYGINLTRAYTIQGRKSGYSGVLSVGRVQTPVLGLVVRRDQTIADFVPKPFYEVLAHLQTETQDQTVFTAKWQPSDACKKWQDEEGRILHKPLAENVVARIHEQPAKVSKLEHKPKRNSAPLPYNLSALQIDANKRFSLSAQTVLDTCQSLYEKHKLITYPRSDCRYLPVDHHKEAQAITAAIQSHLDQFSDSIAQLDYQKRSKAWNDKKVEAHHAIIPTQRKLKFGNLSKTEQQVYELISRQYLIQFMEDYLYDETQVEVEIAGGRFKAQSKTIKQLGWKTLFLSRSDKDNNDEKTPLLPPLTLGQELWCVKGELLEKMTQAPKPFTEATLLGAMTGIARFVEDPKVKQVLKETDGLGTEATRAGIIELLFKRNFLQRKAKAINSTEAGRALIAALPEVSSKPDMTAQWEATLDSISQRQYNYQQFIDELVGKMNELIAYAGSVDTSLLRALPDAKGNFKSNAGKTKYRRKGHQLKERQNPDSG